MPEVVFVDPSGKRHLVEVEPGQSLMRAAQAGAVPGIVGECGGCLTCGTCHVYVEEARATALPPPEPDERAMLDMLLDSRINSRLSCQLRGSPLFSGLELTVAVTQG